MVVVSTPVGVELGAVDAPTDLDAYHLLASYLTAPAEPVSAVGTWVRFVPEPTPAAHVEAPPVVKTSPKGKSSRTVGRVSRPAAKHRGPSTAPTGSTIVSTTRRQARLALHRVDDQGLIRYRASLPALQRLAHQPSVALPAGARSAAEEPVARIPLNPGRASWQASRDLVMAGHLPHPDLIRKESFVAAVGAGSLGPPADDLRLDTRLAVDPDDPHVVWVQVFAEAPRSSERAGPPLDLVLLVDTSGSMGVSGGLDHVRTAVLETARSLHPDDRLTVLSFDGDSAEVLPPTRGVDLDQLALRLASLSADGATDAATGLTAALDVLQVRRAKRGKTNAQIVLFTDGDVMATGQDQWQVAATDVVSKGVGLTTVGIGQAWAEAGPLEAQLARVGALHLTARDGHEAHTLLHDARLNAGPAEPLVAGLTLHFNANEVDTYEVVGWTGPGPGRVEGAAVPSVALAPGDIASAVLKVRLHTSHAAFGAAELGRLELRGSDQLHPRTLDLTIPAAGADELTDQPSLAMAVGAAQLADAMKTGDAEELSRVAGELAKRRRSGHPEDDLLLTVARRSANLAGLPVLLPGEDDRLQPWLADLMHTLGEDCFDDFQARRGDRHGQITARARYHRGHFAGATILDDPLADRMLEACVIQRLRTLDPPGHLDGDLVLPLVWGPSVADARTP